MRTSIILAVLILVSTHQLSAQVPKRYQVVGPVKSFRQEAAKLTEVNGKTVEGPRVLIQTATYDNHGKVIDHVMNNSDGTLKWKSEGSGESTYDSEGREIDRVSRNANGEVMRRSVFTYDGKSNQIKVLTYGMTGEPIFYTTFTYDDSGHKMRADHYDMNSVSESRDVFVYDSRGYLSEITHSAGLLQHQDCFKHDDHGNQTEWSVYDNFGKRGLKVSFGYSDDSKGIPTSFLRYDSNDKVVSKEVYTYEFDARGNWIKSKTRRELYVGEAPVIETEVTYRTIAYRKSSDIRDP